MFSHLLFFLSFRGEILLQGKEYKLSIYTVILIPAGDASTPTNILITPGILPLPILHTQSIWNPPGLVQTILSLVIPWSVGGLPQYTYTTHSSHIHGTLYWNRIFWKNFFNLTIYSRVFVLLSINLNTLRFVTKLNYL